MGRPSCAGSLEKGYYLIVSQDSSEGLPSEAENQLVN